MAKKAFVVSTSLLVLLGVLLTASFWLVPEDRLNALIARQLSNALGYDVTVRGRPSLSFFPLISVSFGPIEVTTGAKDEKPIMAAKRARGRLSMTSVWRGNPSLRFIVLNEADVTLVRDEAGQSNWSAARFFRPDESNPSGAPSLRFSSRLRFIEFVDSRLTVIEPTSSKSEVILLDNVVVAGPPRNTDLTISGKMTWRARSLEGQVRLSEPGPFIAGSPSGVFVSMQSEIATVDFRGQTHWTDRLRGEGVLEADIFSAPELAQWLGLEGHDLLPQTPFSLLGDGEFSTEKLAMRPVAIRVGAGKADGRLTLDFRREKLGISGTLAFDLLKIDGLGEENGSSTSLVEHMLLMGRKGPAIDLRVSADAADVFGQTIDDLALTLISNASSFSLNIGSANFAGSPGEGLVSGRLSGEVDASYSDVGTLTKANLTLSDFELEALEQSIGFSVPLKGTMSLSVQATSKGDDRRSIEDNLRLKMIADIRDGNLIGIDFDHIFNVVSGDDLISVNGAGHETPFELARFSGTVYPSGTTSSSRTVDPSGIVNDAVFEITEGTTYVYANGLLDLVADQISMVGSVRQATSETSTLSGDEGQNEVEPTKSLSITLGGSLATPRLTSVGHIRLPPDIVQ